MPCILTIPSFLIRFRSFILNVFLSLSMHSHKLNLFLVLKQTPQIRPLENNPTHPAPQETHFNRYTPSPADDAAHYLQGPCGCIYRRLELKLKPLFITVRKRHQLCAKVCI
jgi:hypothetical protein